MDKTCGRPWCRPWPTLWPIIWPTLWLIGGEFCYHWVWTKRGVGHGLPYGPPYGLSVVIFLKLGSALPLTCVNNMPHESVIPTTLFCPFGGVSLKFSTQTRGRLESEKPEFRIKHQFWGTIVRNGAPIANFPISAREHEAPQY